jgi:hypothetical protein
MYWARWQRWRERINLLTYLDGGELAHELGSPIDVRPGLSDAVHAAGMILAELEAKGFIKRGQYQPSTNQRFLGGGGGWTDKLMKTDRSMYVYEKLKGLPREPWGAMEGVPVSASIEGA